MVTRRGFMKLAGLGVGALLVPAIAKAQMEDDMTIHIHSAATSGYSSGFFNTGLEHGDTTDTAGKFPGMVVGVSIFGTESVASILDENGKNFTFVRADVNGDIRSEIWYCTNFFASTETILAINLTDVADFVVGSCCYNYFGGIGYHDGETGDTSDPAQTELYVLPNAVNSISFANLAVNAVGGSASNVEYPRWNVGGGVDNYGLASDFGPDGTKDPHLMQFLNNGVGDIWALSVCELLNYVSNPPVITGF